MDPIPAAAKYLTLMLNREVFGIAIDKVREIIHAGKITPIAAVSRTVRGIINVRGRVIPVVDLNARLGLGSQTQECSCVVIVQVHGYKGTPVMMGLAVDGVGEVLGLETDLGPPEVASYRETSGLWLIRTARFNGRNMTLLDIDRVVAPDLAPIPF